MSVTTNKVLNYPDDYATLKQAQACTQTDILRQYLVERRRALRLELANLERILGVEPERGKR